MLRYIIIFLLVFYEETDQTRQIKVYILHTKEKHEIVETLSSGYDEKTKENISYQEIFKHTQDLIYNNPYDPYHR